MYIFNNNIKSRRHTTTRGQRPTTDPADDERVLSPFSPVYLHNIIIIIIDDESLPLPPTPGRGGDVMRVWTARRSRAEILYVILRTLYTDWRTGRRRMDDKDAARFSGRCKDGHTRPGRAHCVCVCVTAGGGTGGGGFIGEAAVAAAVTRESGT